MATSSRIVRPVLYTAAAAGVGGGLIYVSYRPRNIPGSDPALVPPPRFDEHGTIAPPRFPDIKSRGKQIADLKQSGGVQAAAAANKGFWSTIFGASSDEEKTEDKILGEKDAAPYDLLVIGGGATGTGIALDAATRGLKVAMVERDDFSSGTSSKSTKLVHGGVRYLEKAVWELDYNQYMALLLQARMWTDDE